MAYFYGLIAAFFLLTGGHSIAAFPPTYSVWMCSGGFSAGSPSAACEAYLNGGAYGSQSFTCAVTSVVSSTRVSLRCTGNLGGLVDISSSADSSSLSCPANSTFSNGSCTCDAGYLEDGGACNPVPVDPCELLATMCSGSQGMSTNFSLPGRKTGVSFTCMAPTAIGTNDPLPGCSKGCMAQVGGFTTAFQDNSGSWVTTGSAKYSGATCDPSVINDLNADSDPEYVPEEDPTTTDKSDPSCPNGFKGTVNGVSVCVPPKASTGVTEMETKDNGDGTKTDSKTEVKCENGKCEVTKTSTTTNTQTGSTVNSSSVTTTVDKATYCSQNKTAGACKDEKGENEDGNGSFTGNCDSGFQCKGDAITCAIAKKQHADYCEVLKSPEHAAYVAAKAITGKVTDDLPGNQTINLMDRFSDGDDFIGAGSCPPDRSISFIYGEVVIPYSQLCPWFSILGNIMVVVSCIAGARIIVGRYS